MVNFLNKLSLLLLFSSFFSIYNANAQSFFFNFDDEIDDSVLRNVHLHEDSSAYSGKFVYKSKPEEKYALGMEFPVDDAIGNHNGLLSIDMMLRSDSLKETVFVLSIIKDEKTILWKKFPLNRNFYVSDNQWHAKNLSIKIPNDFLKNSIIKCYFLNTEKEEFYVDDLSFKIEYFDLPDFLNEIEVQQYPEYLYNTSNHDFINILYSKKERNIILADDEFRIMTKPLSIVNSFVYEGDTIDYQSDRWKMISDGSKSDTSYYVFKNEDEFFSYHLKIESRDADPNADFYLTMKAKKDVNIVKSSLLMSFRYDDFIIYRKNMYVDSLDYQDVYYLDKEGFSLVCHDKQLNLYHPDKVSSIQIDTRNSDVFINMDYHYDHLLGHYQLMDTSNYCIDKSMTFMQKKSTLSSKFSLSLTEKSELPRIMPVMDAYESAVIFTEHADWADIKTHRATYFGREDIADADSAVGGFVYYDVPITKSVFYNNPDSVTNLEKNAAFPGLHSTVMTDSLLFDFLKQLDDKGFDICLHTPEQYTSDRDNLDESLSFMKEHFASPSWIDHGYNNSSTNNREDLICDGLDSLSPYYVYDLWKEHGVSYPFNPTYEEMMVFHEYFFENQLMQPYPGFGDALPLPKTMSLPNYPDILLWTTFSTMEPNSNWAWGFFFSQDNLDKIVDFRNVYITHCYPPWVTLERGYWEIKDGTIFAKKGFDEALKKIAELKDQHLMLPTTIADYMRYQEQLRKLEYRVNADGVVSLVNHNDVIIKGLSLICTEEMKIENKEYKMKKTKSGDEWIISFDILPFEEVFVITN